MGRLRDAFRSTPAGHDHGFYRAAAGLAVQAAEALDHAHQNHVIHRDIKPANLLLDRDSQLWVADFGLARLQEESDLTRTGDLVGTLRYMSPEQALGKRVRIDDRTDIYSLGVTLYELLTLTPAITGQDRQEVLHRIAQEEPRPPRQVDPAIPRDLETIVLEAIAKDRDARYATAKELADDLRRFLEDKPITARPPGILERAAKLARRHKAAVSAAVAVLLLAAVVLAASNILIARERDEARRQWHRAEANFQDARAAVDHYLTRVSHEKLLDVPGLQPLRKELYETALHYYEQFIRQHEDDPGLQSELADALERVGIITELIGSRPGALEFHRRAAARRQALVRDHPAVLEHRQKLAKSYDIIGNLLNVTGHAEEAEQAYRRAITILEPLIGTHPDVSSLQQDLARSYGNLGIVQRTMDHMAEAEQSYRRAIEILERDAGQDDSEIAKCRQALAQSYTNLGSLKGITGAMAEAGRWFQKAIPIFEALIRTQPDATSFRQDLGKTHYNIATLQLMTGQTSGADRSYRQAIEIQERLMQEHPSVVEFQQDLANTYTDLGILLLQTDKREAARLYQRAIDIQEPLARTHPQVVTFEQDLARSYSVLGILQTEFGLTTPAMNSLQRALTIQGRLVRDQPNVPENQRRDLSATDIGLGKLHRALDQPMEALKAWQEAVRLIESLKEPGPYDLYNLAGAYALSSTVIGKPQARSKPAGETTAQEFLAKAMDALRRSVAAGWSDARQMETDDDLKPLRARDDFRALSIKVKNK